MFIKSIELNNFRCHKHKRVDFTDGINLILGKNGAGKSSILEAIGYALLNIDNNRSVKDQILRGEKAAQITLDFIANDGIEYIIEKTLKDTSTKDKAQATATTKLFRVGESYPLLSDNKSILAKNAELLGLSSNPENLFSYVITAYQNKFIDVFRSNLGNDQIINKIFNTEIYRKLWEYIRDNYQMSLKDNKLGLEGSLTGLSTDIFDTKILKDDIKQLKYILDGIAEELSFNEKIKNENSLQLKLLQDIKQDLAILEQKKLNSTKLITQTNESISSIKSKLQLSIISRKTLEDNIDSYNKYLNTDGEISQLNNSISALEKINKNLVKAQESLNKNEQEQIKLSSDISQIDRDNNNKSLELQELKKNSIILNTEITDIKTEIERLEPEYKQKLEFSNNAKSSINSIIKHKQEIIHNKALINDNKISVSVIELEQQLESLNNEEQSLKIRKTQKEELSLIIKNLQVRLDDNEESRSQLSDGDCPILKEKCKNISASNSNEEYFANKAKVLNDEIQVLDNKVNSEYLNIDLELESKNKQIAELKSEIKSTENKLSKINELDNKLELIQKDVELENLRLTNYLSALNIEYFDDYELISENIQTILQSYSVEISGHKVKLSELSKNHNALIVAMDRLTNLIEQNSTRKAESEKSLVNYINDINTLKNNIEVYNSELIDFELIKSNREELTIKLSELKPAYQLYTKNQAQAEQYDTLNNELKMLEDKIIQITEDIDKYNNKIMQLSQDYDENKFNQLNSNQSIIEEKIKEIYNNKLEISNAKTSKEKDLESSNSKLEQIEKIKNELNTINKKYDLTDQYRAYLNEMGRLATAKMLQKIEILATENYRKLSNKNESIRWLNEGKNYSIQLINNDDSSKARYYEMLSGGEQVSVALSMRAALSTQLTATKFAIFDEPTINLDTERKMALSDSLHHILKSMQTIIVTHDDIFRETAGNIIEL